MEGRGTIIPTDEIFKLNAWTVKPEAFKEIEELPGIKEIHVEWEWVNGQSRDESSENKLAWDTEGIDLSVVESLPLLEKLVLKGVHTGHDGHWNYMLDLTPLRSCKKLRFLAIEGQYQRRPFTKTDLTPLSDCKNLQGVSFSRLSLRYIDLSPLSFCPKLESITVTNSSRLTGLKLPSNPAIRTINI
ncbi:MAG: hypothetical protein ACW96M_02280, partial [Candidatus Thorarchaeota archaeon]